uniref:Uncharacterized protein n=1 Tax=Sinocyclocheilus rhinocerous TaxID=307959 RepID=A0A673KKM6_9TELE
MIHQKQEEMWVALKKVILAAHTQNRNGHFIYVPQWIVMFPVPRMTEQCLLHCLQRAKSSNGRVLFSSLIRDTTKQATCLDISQKSIALDAHR